MEARCQCGSVSFKTPLEEPLALYICHCDSCKRQTSSAFGTSAIFPRFEPPDNANLSCYARPTAKGPLLYCYFCQKCGTRLLHSTPAQAFVSVKGGCITGLDWSKAVHLYTRSAMVPIPEASEAQCAAALSESEYERVQETLDQPDTPASSPQDSVSPSV